MDEIRKYVAANVPRLFRPLDRSPPRSLKQVCESSPEFLAKFDIATLNLWCASGLPHSDNIDFERYYDWLEEAAHVADFNMRRHLYRFNASPDAYNLSQGYFCCYHLLQTLQEDFGVQYNPARVRDPKFQDPKCLDPDFSDSRDLFIHGIIDGPGGTCASMPVVYTAVGRILGYPLKLVLSRGHVFFRWDDPAGKCFGYPDVFNVEGAGSGIHSDPDEFYRTWPEPWTEQETLAGCYLKSLSPAEELAEFLVLRGECLFDNRRFGEALQAYDWACALAPHDGRYQGERQKAAAFLNRKIENDLVRMEQDQRRRHKLLEDACGGPAPQPAAGRRPHGPYCLCPDCRNAKEPTAPPHGASCQCQQCQRAMQNLQKAQGHPGHPPGCPCQQCRRPAGPPGPFGPASLPPVFDPFAARRHP